MPRLFDSVILGAHVHAIQRVDGRVVIAKHFSGSPVGDPGTSDAEELVRTAARVLPGLKDAIVERVTEIRRVIPSDGLPVVSRSASLPGVLSITTNAGISLAAGLSQLITTELLDNVRVAVLDPYRSEPSTVAKPTALPRNSVGNSSFGYNNCNALPANAPPTPACALARANPSFPAPE